MKFSELPYQRMDMKDIERDFQAIYKEFDQAKSGEEQFEVHKKYYALTEEISTTHTLANIRHDIDTKDAFYAAENDYYDEILPMIQNLTTTYSHKLFYSPYKDYLVKKIGEVAFKNIELEIKSFDQKLIPLMQEENTLISRYDRLIAGAEIEFDGDILNLSLLQKYLTSSDRDVRVKAHKKRTDYFLSIQDELDEIYDKLVKNRTVQAKEMGYANYTELGYYRMGRNSYTKEMVEVFREQVKKDLVPLVMEIQENRRKRLSLSKLTYIDEDVYFQEGNPAPIGTPEEILAAGQKMYSELSPETKEFFDFMMEHQLFDVLGRKTKKAGGYMTNLPKYKAPFIFANFNGTSGDIDVITHECGHAFQGYLVRNEEIKEHQDITMETAETHSMSMEYFTMPWMELFFGDRTDDYKKMHLESSLIFVPYGCLVDEFQHVIYDNPDMTPQERKDTWKRLEKIYRPHLDYLDDPYFGNGSFWQKQLHIYNYPFYYIDYCLATVCALQLKVKMDENYDDAWEKYLNFCKASAKDFFVPMLGAVGLNSPFEDGSIREIAAGIRKVI